MSGTGAPEPAHVAPVTTKFLILVTSEHPYTPEVIHTSLKEGLQDYLQARDLCVGTHISVLPL